MTDKDNKILYDKLHYLMREYDLEKININGSYNGNTFTMITTYD